MAAATPSKPWSLKDLNILIVDDLPDMRQTVRAMLQPLGANRCTEAKNGEEAVDAMKRQTMDVVFCDYNLGKGKDGQQVLEEARALNLLPYSSIFILITAEDTSHMVLGAIEFEPDGYLVKPFLKAVVESRIKKFQEKKAKLGKLSAALGAKRYEQAIDICDQLLQDPTAPASEVLRIKGSMFLRVGEYEAARKLYSGVLAKRDLLWARLGLGQACSALKEYPQARDAFEQLLSQNNRCVEAHDCLAKVHKALGDTFACQSSLAAAVRLSPKTILRQRALAEVAFENNDTQTAEAAFKTALREGKHSVHRSPSDFGGLADIYLKKGNNDEAIRLVTDMAKEFRNEDVGSQAKTFAIEARVFQSTGKTEQGAQSLDKAMRLFRQNPTVLPTSEALTLVETAQALGKTDCTDDLLKHIVRNSCEDAAMIEKIKAVCDKCGAPSPVALIEATRREIIATNNEGVELAKQDKYREAIALFLNAARSMPDNITINLNVAMACISAMQKNGVDDYMRQQAEVYLGKVRDIEPANDRLKKLYGRLRDLTANLAA